MKADTKAILNTITSRPAPPTKQKANYLDINTDDYFVPDMLWPFIAAHPEKEQAKYAFVTSMIHCLPYKDENFESANIARKTWQNKLGNNYRKYIDDLKLWGVIKIQHNSDGRESFSQSRNGKEGFCKCYALTDAAKEGGSIQKYKRQRAQKVLSPEINAKKNDIDMTNPIIAHTANACHNLEIRYNEQVYFDTIEEMARKISGEAVLKSIHCHNFSVRYGKRGNRLFHPVIICNKHYRRFIFFKHSDKVNEYDVATCFPVLLLKFVAREEWEEYKAAITGDIYNTITGDTDKTKREACKKDFQKWVGGQVQNYVAEWFLERFPLTYHKINGDKDMAAKLQRLESYIMVECMVSWLIENQIKWVIPMHDGFLTDGNEETDARVKAFVRLTFLDVLGYCPDIGNPIRRIIQLLPEERPRHESQPTFTDAPTARKIQLAAQLNGRMKSLARTFGRRDETFSQRYQKWLDLKQRLAVLTENISATIKPAFDNTPIIEASL
ncbi:MAG: hypothetical protein WCO56_16295 [Verrucomicrobiota bacterium]